jgi:hypothetical protein
MPEQEKTGSRPQFGHGSASKERRDRGVRVYIVPGGTPRGYRGATAPSAHAAEYFGRSLRPTPEGGTAKEIAAPGEKSGLREEPSWATVQLAMRGKVLVGRSTCCISAERVLLVASSQTPQCTYPMRLAYVLQPPPFVR